MDLLFSSLLFSSPVTILVSSRLLFSFFRWLQLRRVHAQTDGRRRRRSSTDLAFLVAVRGGPLPILVLAGRGEERELCD
jgi:hypothetical protein